MDYFLVVLAVIFVIMGLAGCILPVIPGPPLSFIALLLLHFTCWAQFETNFLIIIALVAVVVTLMDYVLPVWVTKKTGGTKAGVWGSIIGLFLGILLFPPIGIIVGPFFGALAGELLKGSESKQAIRAGFGSFLGFLLGTGLKLITSMLMTWYFFKELFT